MNKQKRAQVTLFIILAIIIVSAVLLFVVISNNPLQKTAVKPIKLEGLQSNVQDCLKNASIEAVSNFGLNETILKQKIYSEIEWCSAPYITDLKTYYSVNSTLKAVSVNVTEENVLISLDYPITATLNNSTLSLSSFTYAIQRENLISIDHDSECRLLSDEVIYSFDLKMKIFIPKNTIAKEKSGNCLNSLSLKIDDPIIKNNDRSTSLSALMYTPTEGAYFSDGYAEMDFSYTDKDYSDFLVASAKSYLYSLTEEDLSIFYYDKQEKNFFVYSEISLLSPEKNLIQVRATRFFDGSIRTDSSCASQDNFWYESLDRRVSLEIKEGDVLKGPEGECLSNIAIKTAPKSSNVVNFGDKDYILLPAGSTFYPSIVYTYRYTQQQITSPTFLYGYHNWKDLINNTWQDPTKSTITGNVIGSSSFKPRNPSSLRIVFYEESSGVYRPYLSKVDEAKKTISARIPHFTEIEAGQSCDDEKYYMYPHAAQVPLDSNDNCTGQMQEETRSITITNKNTCGPESAVFHSAIPTAGDASTVEPITCGASCSVKMVSDDQDNEKEDLNLCAYTNLYTRIVGLGFEIDDKGRGKEITKEEYFNATSMGGGNCTLSNNFCCDDALDVFGENLCKRCANDMGCSSTDSEMNRGWECSRRRVNNCVSDNSGAEEEEEMPAEYYSFEELPATSTNDSTSKLFKEVDGVISMEAENYNSQSGYSLVSNNEASGSKAMQVGTAGNLNFDLNLSQAGTWYIWIKTYSLDSENNGLHISIDNQYITKNGVKDIYLSKGGWSWSPEWLFGESNHEGPISVQLGSGKHMLSISKRLVERPLIDKIVLTRNSSPPVGNGPAETVVEIVIPGTTYNGTGMELITGHKTSFLFDDADTRVMNILSYRQSESSFKSVVSRILNKGNNAIYLFLINQGDGPYTPHTFYSGDQIGGQIDSSKLATYKSRLDYLKSKNVRIIFWIRADDSRSMMAQSVSNYKKYHQDVVNNFDSYAAGYVIGLESNEYLDTATEKKLIADLKTRTNKTVGIHLGSGDSHDSRAKSSGADAYYKQYGWVSCNEVASKTRKAILTVSPMKVVAAEYDRDSNSGCGSAAMQAGAIGYGNG